jgi:heme exporter protein B
VSSLRVAWAVFEKDLRAELRAREALVSMVVFALLTVVVFNFGFHPSPSEARELAPGVLWMAFAFSGILGVNRSFAMEREAGATTALLLAPADRGAIYLGKTAANACFLVVLQAVVLPVFAVLYTVDLRAAAPRLAVIGVLGAVAFAAAGTIFAAVSANTRMREVMTPLLLLPAATPVLVAAVEGTGSVLQGEEGGLEGYRGAIRLLALFAIVFATTSYLVFEYVLEE